MYETTKTTNKTKNKKGESMKMNDEGEERSEGAVCVGALVRVGVCWRAWVCVGLRGYALACRCYGVSAFRRFGAAEW